VGFAETSTPDPLGEDFCFFGSHLVCLPFLWQNGLMTSLPTLGGNNGGADGVNNRGQVAGVAENTTLDVTCPSSELQAEPVIWENGKIQQLPTFPGDPDGGANAITDKGQVVGWSGDCYTGSTSSLHALLWQKGTVTNLGSLGGTLYNNAIGINDKGQVTGGSDLPGDTNFFAGPFSTVHAFLWQNGVITDLGTLPGDAQSFGLSINNKGQVVGGFISRAFLWQNGVMTDLNTLVPGPPFSPLYLLVAWDINDRGEIAGLGLASTGEQHAFLAIPCDEDHAEVEGCKDAAGLNAVEQPIEPTGVNPSEVSVRGGNPILGGRPGGTVIWRRPEVFPGRYFSNPIAGTTRRP
jgi:probable HAF family extracellular repeat protein